MPETSFDRCARVRGAVLSRGRTRPGPLSRKEYLLRVTRRIQDVADREVTA